MIEASPFAVLRRNWCQALRLVMALAPVLAPVLVLAIFLASPLAAQETRLEAALIAEGPGQAGEEVWLALHFTPRISGWHGYWRNPGDAGKQMELEWSLPPGWEAGEPQYPLPERFVTAGLMNHVFKGEYAVLVPLKVPQSFAVEGAIPVSLTARWLTCNDSLCVPENAALSALIPVAGAKDARFARWRAAIPPALAAPAHFAIDPASVRLAIPIPQDTQFQAPHIFMEQSKITARRKLNFVAAQRFARAGDKIIIEIPTKTLFYPEGSAPPAFTSPGQLSGILKLATGQGVAFAARPGDVPRQGEPIKGASAPAATPSLLLLVAAALAGGLLLNIMPCVFPILSLKALALARAGADERTARRDALAYTAGVVMACVMLGGVLLALRAGGEQIGWAFQLQEPGVVVGLLVLAGAITANFAGLFELPQISIAGRDGQAGAFATGLLAAIVATPCTGPFMAAALGAALLLEAVPALVLFASLGLGLALPFLLIGFVPRLRSLLPAPGAWMDGFRKAMAIPMGLTALALLWLTMQLGGREFALVALLLCFGIVASLAVVGRLQQRAKMAWPAFGLIAAPFIIFAAFALPASYAVPDSQVAARSILKPERFTRAALARARASGKPVFVWFTADWCVTCKLNERVAIQQEATRRAFEAGDVISIVGDWTHGDEEIAGFLNDRGAAGVPLYLWYPPGGEAEQLPQILTPAMLADRARAVKRGG